MRLRVLGAVLLSAAAYYVYLPLPSGVAEPWKLMLLDALFRSFTHAVRLAREGKTKVEAQVDVVSLRWGWWCEEKFRAAVMEWSSFPDDIT